MSKVKDILDQVASMRVRAPPVSEQERNFVNSQEVIDSDMQRVVELNAALNNPTGQIDPLSPVPLNQGIVGNSVVVTDTLGTTITNNAESVGQNNAILTVKTEDQKAAPIVITLAPPQLPFPITQGIIPVCVFDFGIGGVQTTAEIDWLGGQAFQVVASYLRIYARIDHKTGLAGNVGTFTAFVGRGPKIRNSKLIRSINVGAVTHQTLDSQPFVPPPFATEVQYLYQPTTPTSVLLYAVTPNGDIEYKQDVVANRNPMPLLGAIANSGAPYTPQSGIGGSIKIFNNDAAVDIAESRLAFTIEL